MCRTRELVVVGLAPFRALVPTRDAAARSVDGGATGAERLARRDAHPHHVAWLEGGGDAPPVDADAWQRAGHLHEDARPSLRWVEQVLGDGRVVGGPLGLATLRDLVPHEAVDGDAVARRRARDATQQLDVRPLLAVLPADPDGLDRLRALVVARAPEQDVIDEAGVRHLVWRVPDAVGGELVALLDTTPALLADGHHRVAAAQLDGRARLPTLLATAVAAPRLLPVWRQVATSASAAALTAFLAEVGGAERGAVTVRWRDLRVRCDAGDVLPVVAGAGLACAVPGGHAVRATSDPAVADGALRAGDVVVGGPPPTVEQVMAHVAQDGPLPPKSTAFHPKPRIGLVLARR